MRLEHYMKGMKRHLNLQSCEASQALKRKLGDEDILKKYMIRSTFLMLCGELSNKSVLDLACGFGYFTRLAKSLGAYRVIGVDISEPEIEIAKADNHRGEIEYLLGDASEHDSPLLSGLGSFDMVTAIFLLNYLGTREKIYYACRNIAGCLNPGGKLIAFVDVNLQPDRKYGFTSSAKKPLNEGDVMRGIIYHEDRKVCNFNFHYWHLKTFEDALERAGFDAVESHDPIISEQGMVEFGERFWQEILERPNSKAITCHKPYNSHLKQDIERRI